LEIARVEVLLEAGNHARNHHQVVLAQALDIRLALLGRREHLGAGGAEVRLLALEAGGELIDLGPQLAPHPLDVRRSASALLGVDVADVAFVLRRRRKRAQRQSCREAKRGRQIRSHADRIPLWSRAAVTTGGAKPGQTSSYAGSRRVATRNCGDDCGGVPA